MAIRLTLLLITFSAFLPSKAAKYIEPTFSKKGVVLVVLDKLTNKKYELTAFMDEPATIGTLSIRAQACFESSPEEKPETTAYFEIIDQKTPTDDKAQTSVPEILYRNWMFASAPALNPFNHPQYHITVKSCIVDKS
ncbi:MAG: hypothetical protein C0582_01410 [Alphaproteobacteria bacterium]|jgi:hypothetical protein|nr:MAG: hypothetical protein C0582_01410 [Alphaproteobacteria bacterium]